MKTILVTGSSGFIGSNLVKRLLEETNSKIIGLDNMNDYYEVSLKEYRLDNLSKYDNLIRRLKGLTNSSMHGANNTRVGGKNLGSKLVKGLNNLK